jgi:hypothetical protein
MGDRSCEPIIVESESGSKISSESGSGSMVLRTKNERKKTADFFFKSFFKTKIAIYLSLKVFL